MHYTKYCKELLNSSAVEQVFLPGLKAFYCFVSLDKNRVHNVMESQGI